MEIFCISLKSFEFEACYNSYVSFDFIIIWISTEWIHIQIHVRLKRDEEFVYWQLWMFINEPPEHLKYKILGNFQLLILLNVIISTPINFLNPTDPWKSVKRNERKQDISPELSNLLYKAFAFWLYDAWLQSESK